MIPRVKLPGPPPLARDAEPRPATTESLEQLHLILESARFRTSKRCSAFLKYVVEGVCSGSADLLKERTLGVAVFDRQPDYDTNQDPVVRNTAGEVRKRLAQYYAEPGRSQEIRIDLPLGAYVPEITKPAPAVVAPVAEPVGLVQPVPGTRAKWWILAGLGLGLAGIGLFFMFRTGQTALDRFWAPLLNEPGPVVLCVGQGHTYKLRGNLDRVFESRSDADAALETHPPIPVNDILPAYDRYVGVNDAQAVTRLAVLFTRFGKDVTLRGGRSTTLADLRGKPSVLIGAFNNEWTLNLTGELRFHFQGDAERKIDYVRDRQNPANRNWQVRMDAADPEMDYAIVSRVFNPTTEQSVVVAAGIKGGGTNAAAEFLTNPAYLTEALRSAPGDWAKKNMQFVLAVRLFSGNPGPPQVIATYYW